MKLSSDFECGNGSQFAQTGPSSWRAQIVADRPGYDHYFCIRLDTESEQGQIEIEILPDPGVRPAGPAGDEPSRGAPAVLWRRKGSDGAWERLARDAFEIDQRRILIPHTAKPGETWFLSELCPLPWSDVARHIETLPTHCPHVSAVRLGETPEGRPLLVARVTDPSVPNAEKGRVFVIAGQHGVDFAGIFAAKGALDFLASHLPQAAALRRRYVFDILPCANPDGNAHGRACFNSQDLDQLAAFRGVSRGETPATAEALLIWRALADNPPDLILNFHTYPHPRPFGDPPYEGIYVVDPDRLKTAERRYHQQVLNHALFYLTAGGSQHRRPCPALSDTLEHNAAKAWNTLAALYSVQATEGPHPNLLTGIHVLRTVVETLELAQEERDGV